MYMYMYMYAYFLCTHTHLHQLPVVVISHLRAKSALRLAAPAHGTQNASQNNSTHQRQRRYHGSSVLKCTSISYVC